MSLFGSEMTLEAAMELFPSLKGELVRVIYENEENGDVAFQFSGDGGYMTQKIVEGVPKN